jgi:thiamine-phosphate diphosphorylase/hydroxyethylthiazole kinase
VMLACDFHHLILTDLPTARNLLGEAAIIGVTVSNMEEALKACRAGADYLGVGTMFATST